MILGGDTGICKDFTSEPDINQIQLQVDEEEGLTRSLALFDFSNPLPPKRQDTVRLFYNNCNGLEINNLIEDVIRRDRDKKEHKYIQELENPTKFDSIIRQMKTWEVDIVSLAETCVDWGKIIPRRTIHNITRQYDSKGRWASSTSSINIGNFLKPGGTATLSMRKMNGRILDRGSDKWKMGRWSYTLYGKNPKGTTILVITGYRTGNRTGPAGVKTTWSQQEAILWKENRQINPHESFFIDLGDWITQYRTPQMEIILCMDANERWSDDSEVKKFAWKMDLLNVNQALTLEDTHPNVANIDRSTTIDYCLCSQAIMDKITYAGSTPYDLMLGDHRGFILDIRMDEIFQPMEKDDSQVERKLVLSNPKAVANYLEFVETKFNKQNIFQRSRTLLRRVLQGHTDMSSIMRKYEALDREVLGICSKAEKRCKPDWAGRYEWSPKLAQAIKQLAYWRSRLKDKGNTVIREHLETELQIKYTALSDHTIHLMINESKKKLRDIQQNARTHRQAHLEELAQNYSNQNNISLNRAILELMSHEKSRTTFTALRHSLKKVDRRQLTTLWIATDENGEYSKDEATQKILSSGEDIHTALLKRNAKHLRQASRTPFARGWLRQGLKWDGTGRISDSMLTGEILNQKRFTEAMQVYLECIKLNDLTKLNRVKPILSLEEYHSFWKKKRENTVTSPFGLHVGHYKAATYKLNILDVHRTLLLIPFQTGMVPVRWRRTVQTMLEKDPGSPWIHRLRIIELFDAQANAGFQIFVGRKMMRHAVENNLLCEESFGSTPGKMSSSALVQKIISIDQLRLERRAGGLFDCDASGCYDRIIPPLASVHLQALGLQQSIGTFLARLMFLAKRHVKTTHGISKQNIGTTRKKVLHGIGQGNGGGPAMWIAHLTIMFTALASVCNGFVMTCVETLQKISTLGTGYVDDVTLTLSLSRDTQQSERKVHAHIKRMSQLWEQLLYITGGRLELSKCFWLPITWRWHQGKPKMVNKNPRGKALYVRESETKEWIPIPRKTGSDAEKRLGVYYSCNGKWTQEFLQWKTYSGEFGNRIRQSQSDRLAGYLAYHAIWIAKFRYSAAVLGFSKSQLSQIQKKIISPCLSVAGYCQKLPRAVVYGPTIYGGMEWDNLNVLFLFEKLKLLIGSIRLNDKVGQMFGLQLSWVQIFAGISTRVLMSKQQIDYIPTGWIKNLHCHLVENDIQVEVANIWGPSIQREDDRVIMDIVINTIPRWAWSGINRCRLFLGANTISDISSIDGRYIPRDAREVKKPLRPSKLQFPFQTRPSNTDIALWHYLVESVACNGILHGPLGRWIRTPDQFFPFMISMDRTIVYKRLAPGWQVYGKRDKKHRYFKKLNFTVRTTPDRCTPVRVIETSNYLVLLQSSSQEECSSVSWPAFNTEIHRYEEQVLGTYSENDQQLDRLHKQWHNGVSLIAATDGGLKDAVGTSSYVLLFPQDTSPIVQGYAGEYQPRRSASSTRQELLGQLGVEYYLNRLASRWGVPRGTFALKLVTDSKASIAIMENTHSWLGIKDTLSADMDIGMEIARYQVKNFWVSRETCKVESHIEEEAAPDTFLWKCNELADNLATTARESYTAQTLQKDRSLLFPGTKAGCVINGRHENNDLYRSLKEHITGRNLQIYLMEKYGWSAAISESIDWVEHQRQLRQYTLLQRVTLIKYIHGWFATQRRQCRIGATATSTCPLCGREDNSEHIFHCQAEHMHQIRQGRWIKLLQDVVHSTEDGFKQIFRAGMMTIMGQEHPSRRTVLDWPQELVEAYDSQTGIGWDQVLYGRMSTKWESLSKYNSHTHGKQTKNGWTGRVIKLCWTFGLEMWKVRNGLIHGTDGTVSVLERQKTMDLALRVYGIKNALEEDSLRNLFPPSEATVRNMSYYTQIAWIEQVKFLCKDRYEELVERMRMELRAGVG